MTVITASDKVYEPVADFYAGKSVFITGGTGFLGKVFIEKLLYTCPDIDKIYILIRDKKGVSSDLRIKDFVNNPIFSKLKNKRPMDLDKIIAISGDIEAPNFGLKPEDEEILIEKVSVVIHSAATVKFNEPLKYAWKVNVEGTKTLLDLSKRMKNIQVFIHISTAFTNTDRQIVEEVLYPPPADIDEVYLRIKDGVTPSETRKILSEYLKILREAPDLNIGTSPETLVMSIEPDGRPNTYTFTKSLTEHVVAANSGTVPTIIVRPSIVTAAKEHPINGWLDNWYGATGISSFTAKGLNRVVHGDEDNFIDLIPVDYVANLVIVAGARSKSLDSVTVYNCCSSDCNPITLGKIIRTFKEDTIKYDNSRLYIPILFTTWKLLVFIVSLLLQLIPAYLGDIWRRFQGKRPRYMKLHSLAVQTREALAYFTSHSWIMKATRVRKLYADLSPSDQDIFPCDPTDINWDKYMIDYCWGVRRFLEHKV